MVNGTQGAAHCLRNWAPTDQISCDWSAYYGYAACVYCLLMCLSVCVLCLPLSWRLTTATNNEGLLRQMATAQYFRSELQKLPAPNGVLKVLDKIAHIMEKPNIAETEVQEVSV